MNIICILFGHKIKDVWALKKDWVGIYLPGGEKIEMEDHIVGRACVRCPYMEAIS